MYRLRDLIADVWFYIREYRKDFWVATFSRVVADLVWLYPAYAFSLIVNFFADYAPGRSLTPLYITFTLLIVATVIRHVAIYAAKMIMYRLSERAVLGAQQDAMQHLMLIDISWHEKESAGSKFKCIERGAANIDRLLRIWVNNVIEITINLIGIIIIMMNFDRGIGIAMTIFMVTYFFMAQYYRRHAVRASDVVNAKEEKRSGIIFESINNIRSVKVMSMFDAITDRLSVNAVDMFTAIKDRIYWFSTGNTLRSFYAYAFRIGAMIFIVYGIVIGRFEIGFLVLFVGYFGSIWQSMSELADRSEDIAVAKIAVFRMQTILKVPITIDNEEGKTPFPLSWQTITLQNVSFSYQDKLVLDRISFTVRQGEKVGIVGLSGAGKSTLFKLLLKEHESYTGEIRIDDIPLRQISKKDYFHHLAVVLQETELFNMSLRENITITNQREEKNDALLARAIEVAHVGDFMEKLPDGVDSLIGDRGVKLSGGEKQRVGLARAIFKDPQILLLDEATSHLDIESEEKIQDSLHTFLQDVTAIVIAHRLTTIKEMDTIIVIENGTIIESGSFTELFEKKGRFFSWWEKQKL